MAVITGAWVRRWGFRAVALTLTGVGLYVVMPSLLMLFGSWPRLADVRLRWFVVLALLELGSFAALWWLTRLALEPDPAAVLRIANFKGLGLDGAEAFQESVRRYRGRIAAHGAVATLAAMQSEES